MLEMNCDMLCVRTMHVSYVDPDGNPRQKAKSGYHAKVLLLPTCRDIEVSFSAVGGTSVYQVDRSQAQSPWVKDAAGQYVPERFVYASNPPQHLQFFIRGTTLHSWVSDVDERQGSQSLLELVSRDFLCVVSMQVAYTDKVGRRQEWSGSGYKVKCHLQSDATEVEVSFSAVGGRKVQKVDRRDPQRPWIEDANGHRPLELFFYDRLPPCVQYDIRGPAFGPHVSRVFEQRADGDGDGGDLDADALALSSQGRIDLRTSFEVPPDEVPSIGGFVDRVEPHNEFLLPPEVVLFEPTEAEVFHLASGARQIFLNTPLTEHEHAGLGEMHRLLAKRGIGGNNGDFPKYMEQNALRMLQTAKFNVPKAVDMMKTLVKERVRRLPISEPDVVDDLRSGWIYWHGRDRQCRPCLVIRMERIGDMMRDKERTVRSVIATLEYALRYAMVPGRVENWVVIIDLANVFSVVSPMHIGSLSSTAAAIGTTLEKVYCGRMVWIKIINMPGGAVLSKVINSTIPADKKDKVNFPQDVPAALAEHFEHNQLEQRYGGTAPDLKPSETYPYRFFPNPRGDAARGRVHTESQPFVHRANSEVRETEDFSLHDSANLPLHEGTLWDDSSAHARARWLNSAASSSLTPAAAEALSNLRGQVVEPCRDVPAWLEMMNPAALQNQKTEWAETPIKRAECPVRREAQGPEPTAATNSACSDVPAEETFSDGTERAFLIQRSDAITSSSRAGLISVWQDRAETEKEVGRCPR